MQYASPLLGHNQVPIPPQNINQQGLFYGPYAENTLPNEQMPNQTNFPVKQGRPNFFNSQAAAQTPYQNLNYQAT